MSFYEVRELLFNESGLLEVAVVFAAVALVCRLLFVWRIRSIFDPMTFMLVLSAVSITLLLMYLHGAVTLSKTAFVIAWLTLFYLGFLLADRSRLWRSRPLVLSSASASAPSLSGEAALAVHPPRITVASVVFNAEPVVRRAFESVRRCRGRSSEYIVVDGASRDRTLDLIREYDAVIDSWTSEPDEGIYDAMNKAVDRARGDWLLFLGADDELLVDLDSVAAQLTDAKTVYYGDVELRSSRAISGGRFSRYTLMQRNICHQAIFYPRAVYRHKRYDTTVGMLADHKYNIELWGAGVRFCYLGRVIARFDDSGRSSADPSAFEPIKLAAVRASFGFGYWCVKRLRNATVRLLKGRREST
jgi:hypothetical protein